MTIVPRLARNLYEDRLWRTGQLGVKNGRIEDPVNTRFRRDGGIKLSNMATDTVAGYAFARAGTSGIKD